eukprot:jgi/Picre1/29870/NNA_005252.t1
MAPKKKVAAVPAAVRKPAAAAKPTNPLYEKRTKSFGIGGIFHQREICTDSFTKTLDKSSAETVFKLLMKYRPEDKAAKKERLLKEAEARAAGNEVEKKKPVVVKFGINQSPLWLSKERLSS